MSRKLLIASAMTLWTLLFAAMAMASPDAALEHYNRGTELYGKGEFEAAERELTEAIRLEPAAADAYYNRGWSYRRRLMDAQAFADFSHAILLNREEPAYFLSRANVSIVLGDYDGGISDATRAAEMVPDSSRAYFLRGVAYLLKEEPQSALEDAVRAVALEPEYTDARRLLLGALVTREAFIRAGRWTPAVAQSGAPALAPKASA